MTGQAVRSKTFFQTLGVLSPYITVVASVFFIRTPFLPDVLYHFFLLVCILKIKGIDAAKLFAKGAPRFLGTLICLGGIVPGLAIFYFWPLAKLENINLADILAASNMNNQTFLLFAVYACLVNPVLEESFWRGCFSNRSFWPNRVDALFAGYHALAVVPIVKPSFVILVFIAMTFVGWLFRNAYRITGGLLIPVLTHLVADIAILYAFWRLLQQPRS